MIKPDLQALDDKVWRNRNVKAELAYCGTYMKHRKSITNLDLRFYAWLFRAALKRIEELEGEDGKGKEEKAEDQNLFQGRENRCDSSEILG